MRNRLAFSACTIAVLLVACDHPELKDAFERAAREAVEDDATGRPVPPPPPPPAPDNGFTWGKSQEPLVKACRAGEADPTFRLCPAPGSGCPGNYPHIGCNMDGGDAILACAPIDATAATSNTARPSVCRAGLMSDCALPKSDSATTPTD
jgi:hypothetical protein